MKEREKEKTDILPGVICIFFWIIGEEEPTSKITENYSVSAGSSSAPELLIFPELVTVHL